MHTLGSPIIPNIRRDPLVINVKRFRNRFNIRTKRCRYSRSFSGRHVNYECGTSLAKKRLELTSYSVSITIVILYLMIEITSMFSTS